MMRTSAWRVRVHTLAVLHESAASTLQAEVQRPGAVLLVESATRNPLSRSDHEYEGDKTRSLQTEFQLSRTIIKRVREENTLFDVKSPKMLFFIY